MPHYAKQTEELIAAKRELALQIEEKEKRTGELAIAIQLDIEHSDLAEEQILKLNEDIETKTKRALALTESLEHEHLLNIMKSQFVSIASHEFRTPLSVILSSVSLIEKYNTEEHEGKRKKHIDRIKLSVGNLVSILDDFLSLEKLEQGKVEVTKEKFDLFAFANEIKKDVDGLLKTGQRIELSCHGEKVIEQDKKILKNVILNLLSNAIKYSGENTEIYLSAAVGEYLVSIKVKDHGIGIPVEEQQNMFKQFFRAANTTNIQGTGLGLNIVKRYVELMDGTIDFESRFGKGTTFTVAFPV